MKNFKDSFFRIFNSLPRNYEECIIYIERNSIMNLIFLMN